MAGGLSLGCTPVLPGSTRVSPRRHKGCPAGSRAVLGTQPGPPGSRGVGRGEQAPVSLPGVRGTERARARSGTKRGALPHTPRTQLWPLLRAPSVCLGTRVGAPDVRGGSLRLCAHQPRRSVKGARERGPRGTLAPRVPSPDLCVDTRVRSTSVAEGRVSAPQPPVTETVCSPSLLRDRLSRASQWCDLNIQLVFTEHTTVNQRKLNVYLKPPLKALLIIF